MDNPNYSFRGSHLAWNGEGLLDRLPNDGSESARLAIPFQGLHIDVNTRRLGLWTTMWVADLFTEAERLWPGWQVTFWADGYERHAEAAGSVVGLASCDERALHRGGAWLDAFRGILDVNDIPAPVAERARRHLDTAVTAVRRELHAI